MKVRQGFVSNSSSSSFIVAHKGDLEELVNEAFAVKEEHPLKNFKPGKLFVNQSKDSFSTIPEYLKWSEGEGYEEPREDIIDWLNKGFTVSTGYFYDDSGDVLETFLCESTIKFESENLIIEKEGGY